MGAIKDAIDEQLRDFVLDGVASSGLYYPTKAGVRSIGPIVEASIAAIAAAGLAQFKFATVATMNADLAHDAGTTALVYNDPAAANNDLWIKTGASGAGAWVLSGTAGIIHDTIGEVAQPYVDTMQALNDAINFYVSQRVGDEIRSRTEFDNGIVRTFNGVTGEECLPSIRARDKVLIGGLEGDDSSYLSANTLGKKRTLDQSGQPVEEIQSDGTRVFAMAKGIQLEADVLYGTPFLGIYDALPPTILAEINFMSWRGQSYGLGTSAPSMTGVPVYPGNVLSFNQNAEDTGSGIRQQWSVAEDATALQSFVPAVERDSATTREIALLSGETGAVAMGNALMDLFLQRGNLAAADVPHAFVFACPDEGARSINRLTDMVDPVTNPYMTRALEQIQRSWDVAQALGKSWTMPAVMWHQGTNDANDWTTYAAQLENDLRLPMQAKRNALLGTADDDLKVLIAVVTATVDGLTENSMNARRIYDRQVLCQETYPNLIPSSVTAPYPHANLNSVHKNNWTNAEIGRDHAFAFHRLFVEQANFVPLKPVKVLRQGNLAIVKTNLTRGRLKANTQNGRLPELPFWGFRGQDAAGVDKPLTAARMLPSGDVVIEAVGAWAATDLIGYGDRFTGTYYPESARPFGNISDNGGSFRGGRDRWLPPFLLGFDN